MAGICIEQLLEKIIIKATDYATNHNNPEFIDNKDSLGRDYVTKLDLDLEKQIIKNISKYFPDHNILSEETNNTYDLQNIPEHLWIIDPIDGTTNYVYGLDDCAISIAYAHRGVVKYAAVSAFRKSNIILASINKGATLNGEKISVRNHKELPSSLLATDARTDPKLSKRDINILLSLPDDQLPLIRIGGSGVYQLCQVAIGQVDLYFHTKLKPWDKAAAYLIIQEAGGVTKTLSGKIATFQDEGVVAGNSKLVDQLLNQINNKSGQKNRMDHN